MSDPTSYLPLSETLAPENAAAASGLIAHASTVRTPIYPWGGGTQLSLGVRPSQPGYGLSLAGLNRVVDYADQDLTITVEAGITFAELDRHLADKGQRLPVDVPHPERATVGGAVAADSFGPRSYGCGTLRDYVLGLQAVDGCGTPFAGGGRVVKNAAGYDMCRLLTGSLGTLAVITQATLMVRPRPEAGLLIACPLADVYAAERLLAGLIQSQTLPVAIELVAGPLWDGDPLLAAPVRAPFGCLVIGFEGSRVEVEWMGRQLLEEWGPALAEQAVLVHDEQAAPVWQRITDFPDAPSGNGTERVVLDVSVLPAAVTVAVETLRKIDPEVSLVARAGSGLLRAVVSGVPAKELRTLLAAKLRPAFESSGGRVVVRAAPAEAAFDARDVWGPASASTHLWMRLKEQFDPQGILNPGRMQ